MIYFTADNHFYHVNIISSCGRPFNDVHEMNKKMIDNWNSCVTPNDEVYILGDFLYKGTAIEANIILSKLKGKKYLIKGNHEQYLAYPNFNHSAFEWIKEYHVLTFKGIDFILFHYPILEWHKFYRGSIHLYGHVHNSEEKHPDFREKVKLLGPRAVNVGVDMHDFYPVNVYQIIEMAGGEANGI